MRAAVHSGRTHLGPNAWKRIEIIGPTKLENAMYKFATRLSAMEFEDVDFDDVEARLLAAEAAETAAVAAIPKENDCGGACTI